MNISPQTNEFINITLQVILASMWFAIPIVVMLILMYLYKRYKKWESKEIKEAEKILVKKNQDIVKSGATINALTARENELNLRIEALEQREKELLSSLGEDPEDEDEEPAVDYTKLTVKQLQAHAKNRGIKGFSRMSKEKLIEVLSP